MDLQYGEIRGINGAMRCLWHVIVGARMNVDHGMDAVVHNGDVGLFYSIYGSRSSVSNSTESNQRTERAKEEETKRRLPKDRQRRANQRKSHQEGEEDHKKQRKATKGPPKHRHG
eukprot:45536_1